LHGVFAHAISVDQALWLRRATLQERSGSRLNRYTWLEPPAFSGSLSVASIVAEPTPAARTAAVAHLCGSGLSALAYYQRHNSCYMVRTLHRRRGAGSRRLTPSRAKQAFRVVAVTPSGVVG
jgi:hypothetical protein